MSQPDGNRKAVGRPVWLRRPRSAYIHIPFCAQRCGYCNFSLIAGRDDLIDRYLEALKLEMTQKLAEYEKPLPLDTLFLGGGTPSHLTLRQIDDLFAIVRSNFDAWFDDSRPEISIEANPNDLTRQKVEHFRQHGVGRFSLGVQSFDETKLIQLERTHRMDDVIAAVECIRLAGAQVALDLIFAGPGESLADWHQDLSRALILEVDHISTYQLTFEKGTQFWNRLNKGALEEADDELALAMYRSAIDRLTASGFDHYEISNFALPGKRSIHNQVYWRGLPYFAFGPGAASYIKGCRLVNHQSTTTYLKRLFEGQSPLAEQESRDDLLRAKEYLIFGLRRTEGVTRSQFAEDTGMELENVAGPAISQFLQGDFLQWENGFLKLTKKGLPVCDSIWPDLL